MALPVRVRREVRTDLSQLSADEQDNAHAALKRLSLSVPDGEMLRSANDIVRVAHAGRLRIFFSLKPSESSPNHILVLAILGRRSDHSDAYVAFAKRAAATSAPDMGEPFLDTVEPTVPPDKRVLEPPRGGTRDVFLSYASGTRDFARELAAELTQSGVAVWFDELDIQPGDDWKERIDEGIRNSRFVVVILSRSFFDEPWPRNELRAMLSREVTEQRRLIVPIWYGASRASLSTIPELADRAGLDASSQSLEAIADRLVTLARGPEIPDAPGR